MRLPSLLLAAALLVPMPASAQSWAPVPTGTVEVLADVHFVSENVGFAVADGGILLSTTDGGSTWSTRVINAGLDNQGIAFSPSGAVGIIITDGGGVHRTVDGGATWNFISTGMTDGRAAIAWGSEAVVWVAGRDGNAAVSTDAGVSWTSRPSGSAERTEGMAAAGPSSAWVVGRAGEIRHTTNGGVTWTPQASGTADDLKDVQMLDAATGYAVGSGNTVLKTTNGGATWVNVATSGVGGNGVFFLGANTGWVVGDAGQIWFTGNGGGSWALQPSGTSAAFNRVHFPTPVRGFAVGDGGTVVRFTGEVTGTAGGADVDGVSLTAGPNPSAGGEVVVSLRLREAQAVTVAAFDAVGRRVATLHMGLLGAGGHAMMLDASALAPGSYVVRAAGDAFIASARLTVVR